MYKEYRVYAEEFGLTDYAVSKLTGVSRQAISEWKTGKHNLSLRNRHKIATYFGTDNEFKKKIS